MSIIASVNNGEGKVIVGVSTAMPDTAGLYDLFWALDTDKTYYFDGSEWKEKGWNA